MQLPNPSHYTTADQFIHATEQLGRSVGAQPLGPCGIGLLAAVGLQAEYWWSLYEALKGVEHGDDDTVEDVLRRYWRTMVNAEPETMSSAVNSMVNRQC